MASSVGTRVVRPPYFVLEDDDVTAYTNFSEIEKHLEPVDVKNGVYRIFDSTGTEIGVRVTKGRVDIGDPIGNDPDHLAQTLRTFLATVSQQWGINGAQLAHAELPQLVDQFAGRVR